MAQPYFQAKSKVTKHSRKHEKKNSKQFEGYKVVLGVPSATANSQSVESP